MVMCSGRERKDGGEGKSEVEQMFIVRRNSEMHHMVRFSDTCAKIKNLFCLV